ncbi:MAG: stage II sporulation protein M [Saprospiraceae bacterium]|nr:stage II sporulation protein M [Saprospiraceae bacterium]
MKETKFIEQNKEKWTEFEQMLREKNRDPEKLNDLFIQITDDLSYARTFYPNRSVRVFLNTLAQRIFHNIYKGKRFPVERFRLFWTDELPHVMWQTRKALLLSFSIFLLAFSIGVVSSIINPEFARVILGDGYVEMTIENIEKGDPMAVYKESGPLGMTAGIAANNLFVAFRTAIFGVLASIGTLMIMLYNGIMVGAFQYFFIEKGVFWESFLTIWIHGTLEISAIIIAGAAGLVAGSGLLFPGTYRRVQAFQISMRQGLKIFLGIIPIIILAAIFEGFLTRYTETPDFIRAMFIGVSLFFVLWYFVWLPWFKARRNHFKNPEQARELPPDLHEPIGFEVVKSAGEIFGDTFTVVRRHPRIFWFSCLGASFAFLAYVAFWGSKPMTELFSYPRDPWGVLSGASDFFSNSAAPSLYFFQLLLMGMVTLMAFTAVEKEYFEYEPETDALETAPKTIRKVLISLLVIAAVMPLMILFLRAGVPLIGWLFSMVLYPFLSLWCAILYLETANPITAFVRTFKLIQWGPALVLGFLTVNLGMMFFLFLDTPVWEMTLELFRWMVPPAEGAMAKFSTFVTTLLAALLLYVFYYFLALAGAFQYFSNREVADARKLKKDIENVGLSREIRGLARE